MTTRQFTRLVAILALAALAFTACKKGTTNTNNANNTNNTSNTAANKNAPTTPSTGDYSTPSAAFKTFYEAAKGGNIEGIKRSMSKRAMDEITKSAAKENKTVDESLKEMIDGAPSNMPEMRNEKIGGDKATAEMKDDKMDKWEKVYFVKENGQWKIEPDEGKPADMDKMDHGDMDKK